MSEYHFREIHFSEPDTISEGTWLWIWNAEKIPPHIGISRNGSYFSLTYKECELAKPVAEMKARADRAKIPLVLISLRQPGENPDFQTVFSSYTKAMSGKATCLSPIVEALGVKSKIPQLSVLLKVLEKGGNLKSVFALHLASDYKGIPAYSVSEIMQRIEELHDAYRPQGTITSG